MKINPRHNKWRGMCLARAPYGADTQSAAMAALMDHAIRSGATRIPEGTHTTLYYINDQLIGKDEAALILSVGGSVSGFNPVLRVSDADVEVDASLPHSEKFDDEGESLGLKTWREWASRVYPDIEDGYSYLVLPDVQHDYFNKGGQVDTTVLMSMTGADIIKGYEYMALHSAWAATQPPEEV